LTLDVKTRGKGTAHLIHGFAGAGKTTVARLLERGLPAVRFTHDEWMHTLYGPAPAAEDFANLPGIKELLWQSASRILELGCDVVLDDGFWSRDSRDRIRSRLSALGAGCVLYRVTCPEPEMARRVSHRSQNTPPDSLWINEPAFESFKSRFEPLGRDEDHVEIDGTRNLRLEDLVADAPDRR
jgi:predicted kinase